MSEPDLEAIRARRDATSLSLIGRHLPDHPDCTFIDHARIDISDLLDAIDRLRGMLIDAETEAQMQAAEVERLRVADGIVRKMATADWVYDTYICFHCKALVADEEPEVMDEPHASDCLHALALAYVEANPA